MDACEAAIRSGDFRDYQPSFTSNHREPKEGEDIRPLEERACVDLHIVGGRGFVPQPKGVQYIFAGSQIAARYDCGNDARDIRYVPFEIAAAPPPAEPPPPVEEVHMPVFTPVRLERLVEFRHVAMYSMPPAPSLDFPVTIVFDKKGRPIWSYAPIANCVYAYSKDRKNWSVMGGVEKVGICPAEAAAIAWWLWPVGAAVKIPMLVDQGLP